MQRLAIFFIESIMCRAPQDITSDTYVGISFQCFCIYFFVSGLHCLLNVNMCSRVVSRTLNSLIQGTECNYLFLFKTVNLVPLILYIFMCSTSLKLMENCHQKMKRFQIIKGCQTGLSLIIHSFSLVFIIYFVFKGVYA